MSLLAFWRRYRFAALLFSLCLLAVLLFAGEANSTQPDRVNSAVVAAENSALNEKQSAIPAGGMTENVRKIVLDNGLTVLTKEVHTAPVVSVQVWYKIGSRNEEPGVNGIAHQLEHMLFKGTSDRPLQFGRLFSALGSESNAFTSYDQTAYYGTVERNKLRALLTLEADRMHNSLIDPAQLESEKRVVISELQGYENDPGYRLSRRVMQAAFPNSPYGLPVGGTKADVQKFTVDQVRQYYRKYYSPDNATLIVVGDFQTAATLQAVKEIFGNIPKVSRGAGEQVSRGAEAGSTDVNLRTKAENLTQLALVSSTNQNPIVLREEGSAPLLNVVYPLPPVNHPDIPALQVMDYVLTAGRNSRLYQALVESGLTSDAGGYTSNLIGAGWYELYATAVRGEKLTKIDQTLQQAIADLQTKGVTPEELNRAKAQFVADITLGNRNITNQATQLGDNETTAGDYRYIDKLLAGVGEVSSADVQRVAQEYLKPEKRTVGYFEPTQITQGDTGTRNASQTSEKFNLGPPVDPAAVAKYLPEIEVANKTSERGLPESFKLGNGMQVLLVSDRSTPTVTLSGNIPAGRQFDPAAKAGVAELTADNLINGTKTKDALTLAKVLESRGASLGFSAGREGVSVGGYSLKTDLPVLVETLADVVQNATFPTEQLELSRQRGITDLKAQLDNPNYLGFRTLQQQIFPQNHPFHSYPTLESLKAITRADVVEFYQTYYRPDNTVLALVGDFDPQEVRSLLEKHFANWTASGKPPQIDFPPVDLPEKIVRLNPVLPGKTQAITVMGYRGINRQDSRYYAALVLNQILGGDTLSSRLGTEIRDRLGLTYSIYSYFQAGKQPGLFIIDMQTAPEDANKAISSTIALLKQICTSGFTAAEVETAKGSLTSSYSVSLADPDSLTAQILMNEVYGLSREEIRNFPQKIQAVTLEQVNQVAKELLHPDNLVVVTAGPNVT
ncbi:M16 family metallopeptidase [Microseira wollei]|uniref:Peptidase M16 domain-containing protein n=1 Tax=Microseira wollei NIES-4236 TaxID=2530354 RepID=A0AAV3XTY0_9CYAN|nr:pitrilysin family protein [Microseira wollei]GET43692.1 peptidase M16 domain-containing protein [Microseira wollei NIES-4236]